MRDVEDARLLVCKSASLIYVMTIGSLSAIFQMFISHSFESIKAFISYGLQSFRMEFFKDSRSNSWSLVDSLASGSKYVFSCDLTMHDGYRKRMT